MRRILNLIALIFLSIVLSSCDIFSDIDSKPPIKLGAIYNLTGAQSGLDIPSSRGAQLAVREVNKSGGVLGRKIELIMEDGESNPARITSLATEMLSENPSISALFGLSDTDMVLAAAPIAADNMRLFLTSGATSPLLPSEVEIYLYLACFGDNVQAAAGAEWAYGTLNTQSVSVLYNDTMTYTQLLHGYFEKRFAELGGQIDSSTPYDSSNLNSAVNQLNKQSELIYLAAGPDDALAAVKALRNAGFNQPILGGDGLDIPQVWEEESQISNLYYSTHVYLGADSTDPEVVAFRTAYRAMFQTEPDAFAALGYDTARLIFRAIRDADSTEPNKVREALAEIQDFQGVTGLIRYPINTRIPKKSVSIISVDAGQIGLAEQLVPERVPSP
jgi:branched-chain amino acid transport system substrate-binding protein